VISSTGEFIEGGHWSDVERLIKLVNSRYAEEPSAKAQEDGDESMPSTSAAATGKKRPPSSAACTSTSSPLAVDAKNMDDEIDTKLGVKMSPTSTLTSPLSSPEVEPNTSAVSVIVPKQEKAQPTEVPPTPNEMDTIDLNDDDPTVNNNLIISSVIGADDETIIFL
jgi:hypothetical protein